MYVASSVRRDKNCLNTQFSLFFSFNFLTQKNLMKILCATQKCPKQQQSMEKKRKKKRQNANEHKS